MVPMWLMQIGEVVRRRRLGSVRHAAVRYAGGIYRRADGRTPEYLGKKIDVGK
jgi:K+-transporting ATPase A subunit